MAEHERLGDALFLANVMADLAITLSRQGNVEAALDLVERARELARDDDVTDQINLDLAEAHARAAQGEHAVARDLIGSARRRAAAIDIVIMTDTIELIDAELHLARGEKETASAIAKRAADEVRRRGQLRYADALRRPFSNLT